MTHHNAKGRLSKNEKKVLKSLLSHEKPSFAEIAAETGLSKEGVRQAVLRLEKKNYVKRTPKKARSFQISQQIIDAMKANDPNTL